MMYAGALNALVDIRSMAKHRVAVFPVTYPVTCFQAGKSQALSWGSFSQTAEAHWV